MYNGSFSHLFKVSKNLAHTFSDYAQTHSTLFCFTKYRIIMDCLELNSPKLVGIEWHAVAVTSSSLYVIMVKALKTQSVEPVMVMILSGQEPSEMLTRALLCGDNS